MELNYLSLFLLGAVSQGLILMVALITKGVQLKRKSNYTLALLIFLFTFYLFKAAISTSGLISSFPYLITAGFLVVPAIPPLFYIYLSQINEVKISNLKKIFHWLFLIIQTLYWAPFYLSSYAWKLALLKREIQSDLYPPGAGFVFEMGQVLQHLIYILLLYRLYKVIVCNDVSRKKWLQKIILFFVIYAVMFSLGTLSFRLLEIGMPDYIFYGFLAIFIYLIGYYGYTNKDILFEINISLAPKYSTVVMDSEESIQLSYRIVELLKREKLYLISKLKIGDVAKRIDVPVNKVSRSINENHDKSFSELINAMRVEYSKKLLSDAKNNDKLFAIAIDSGFNNKVSFYKNFKAITGMSPSEYRSRQNNTEIKALK